MTRPRLRALLAGTAVLALLAPAAAALAPAGAATQVGRATGLPEVSIGERPGPPVLYAAAPSAPQLENRHPRLRAEPLRVSATEAYVGGEYLYQDYLYDDYGADSDRSRGGSLSERSGDLEYPADESLAGNGADLVEVRIAPGPKDVVYRVTLNSLLRKDAAIVSFAFDTDRDATTGSPSLPGDPGAPFPGTDEVLTVWGTGASYTKQGPAPRTTPVAVQADLEANQLTVTVPRSVSNPRGVWRTTVAAGLHGKAGGWLRPGGPNGIYNLAFRYDEPISTSNNPPDVNQSIALADDAPTRYARDIDFAALDRKVARSTVPATGRQVRFFPSRLQLGEGRDLSAFPQYKGQLQPYAVYLPTTYKPSAPGAGLPLTLSLHSLGQQYWQYMGGRLFEQQGEERGSAVLSPMGRGPDGWYQDEAEVDVFEAWNDLARHVALDPARTYVSGYSMGGYGTYRLAGLYPDLFARAFTVVGPPGDGIWLPPAPPTGGAQTLSNIWLDNLRNVPIMNLAAAEDELVPYVGPRAQNLGAPEMGIRGLEQLGYDYRFLTFPTAEHFTLAALGYDFPMARDFLGTAPVDRDPPHVTFVRYPGSDNPELGLVHDHAYWVSDVRVAEGTDRGVVDARSRAFGKTDPTGSRVAGPGVAQLPYAMVGNALGEPAPAVRENALELTLTGVRAAELALPRARLTTQSPLRVLASSTTDAQLALTGTFAGRTTVTRDGKPVPVTQTALGRIVVPISKGEAEYVITTAAARRR